MTDIRGMPRQYLWRVGVLLLTRQKLPSWQRKSGLFVVFSLEISNPENFEILLRTSTATRQRFRVFLFLVLRRVAHFSRDPFQSRRHVSIPSQRGDMLMNLLVSSRIIFVSCLGVEYLSFSLSISSFNSINRVVLADDRGSVIYRHLTGDRSIVSFRTCESFV